jgi:hypothetical protein
VEAEAIIEGVIERWVERCLLAFASTCVEHGGDVTHIGAEPRAGFLAEADVPDARDRQRQAPYSRAAAKNTTRSTPRPEQRQLVCRPLPEHLPRG